MIFELQPCNFDHGFLFVGRVGVRLLCRGAGFHSPGGGSFHDRRGVGWWLGRGWQCLDRCPGVEDVVDPGPVRAQVQPPFAWHCQLGEPAWLWRQGRVSLGDLWSVSGGCRGRARDLGPGGEPVGHFVAVVLGTKPVTAGPEVWGDAAERGQEPLRMSGGGEAFHRPFRCLVGWWAFSARLFRYFEDRCSTHAFVTFVAGPT